jgi:hypothetical protein
MLISNGTFTLRDRSDTIVQCERDRSATIATIAARILERFRCDRSDRIAIISIVVIVAIGALVARSLSRP